MMKQKFKILRWGMVYHPHIAKLVTTVAVILHNMERIRNPRAQHDLMDTYDESGHLVPGEWRHVQDEGEQVNPPPDHLRGTAAGHNVRNYLRDYFNDEDRGAVAWQWDNI